MLTSNSGMQNVRSSPRPPSLCAELLLLRSAGGKAVCEAAVLPASPNDEVAQGRGRPATLRRPEQNRSTGRSARCGSRRRWARRALAAHKAVASAALQRSSVDACSGRRQRVAHCARLQRGPRVILSAHSTRRSLSWCRRTGGCSYPIALARARARIDSNPLTVRRPSGVSTRIGCEKARKNTRGSLIGLRLRRAGFRTSRLVTSVTPQCSEFHGRSLQTPTTGMLGTPASR